MRTNHTLSFWGSVCVSQSLRTARLRAIACRILGVAVLLVSASAWASSAAPTVNFESYLADGQQLVAITSSVQGDAYLLSTKLQSVDGIAKPAGCTVTRVAAGGDSYVYSVSTAIGNATCQAIAADAVGNVYVAATGSGVTTDGALQREAKGSNAYLYKLDAKGNLLWATYLGGSGSEKITALATDAEGNLLVTGTTTSPDLPVKGSGTANLNGKSAAFVASLGTNGTALNFLSYLNGATVVSLSVTKAGEAVLLGEAGSGFTLKSTSSAQPFLTKFNSRGESAFVTLLAGEYSASAVIVLPDGTLAAALTSPVTAAQTATPELMRFDANGAALGSVTLPAATVAEGESLHLAADGNGNLLLASTGTLQQYTSALASSGEGWLISVTTAGEVNFSTATDSKAGSLASDGGSRIYLAGAATENSAHLVQPLLSTPSTVNGPELLLALNVTSATTTAHADAGYYSWEITPTTLDFYGIPIGSVSSVQVLTIKNDGSLPITLVRPTFSGSSGFAETDNCGLTLVNGKYCTVSVTYTPTGNSRVTGTMIIAADSSTGLATQKISLVGTTINSIFVESQYNSASFSVTLEPGQTAEWDLTLISDGSLAGTATFDCYNLPAKATCTVTPTSLTIAANGSQNFTVKLTTTGTGGTGTVTNALLRMRHEPIWLAMLGGGGLFGGVLVLGGRRRKGLMRWIALALALLTMLSFSGCGKSITAATTTPAGGYTIMLDTTVAGVTTTAKLYMTVE